MLQRMIKILLPAAVLCVSVGIFVVATAESDEKPVERHPWGPLPASETIARVDGRTVDVGDVVAHLRPPEPWVGARPPADPRRLALDEAVRVELFAQEATRRAIDPPEGPPAVVEAALVQGLISRELKDAGGTETGDVSEADVRRYFEDHREISTAPGTVDLSTVVVESAEEARRLLRQAAGMSDREFAQMVREHSSHEPSRSAGGRLTVLEADEPDDEVEDAISGVGYSMLEDGQVGLARASDGRYHVLRASNVERKQRPWDEEAALLTKNLMVEKRQEQILSALEERLRDGAEVEADERDLLKLRAPSWEEYF